MKYDADIVVFTNNKFVDKEGMIQDIFLYQFVNYGNGMRNIQINKDNLKFVLDDIPFNSSATFEIYVMASLDNISDYFLILSKVSERSFILMPLINVYTDSKFFYNPFVATLI